MFSVRQENRDNKRRMNSSSRSNQPYEIDIYVNGRDEKQTSPVTSASVRSFRSNSGKKKKYYSS